MKRVAWRIFFGCGIVYIALIGIFAIEELQRRQKFHSIVTEREGEVTAALAALGSASDSTSVAKRTELEGTRKKLAAIHARLVALIVVGPAQRGPSGILKGISCDLAALGDSSIRCPTESPGAFSSPREIAATIALKRMAEQRSSGDVFAVLIIVAAVGGAPIRLYLPGRNEADAFRTVFRAIGGGIVCFLVISGGSFQLPGISTTALTNPATGSLRGLLAGMFSTKVFAFLSTLVDSWFEKLASKKTNGAPSEEPPSKPAEEPSSKPVA